MADVLVRAWLHRWNRVRRRMAHFLVSPSVVRPSYPD